MGRIKRITETQVAVPIVTMVNVGGETNILGCMEVGKRN